RGIVFRVMVGRGNRTSQLLPQAGRPTVTMAAGYTVIMDGTGTRIIPGDGRRFIMGDGGIILPKAGCGFLAQTGPRPGLTGAVHPAFAAGRPCLRSRIRASDCARASGRILSTAVLASLAAPTTLPLFQSTALPIRTSARSG